MKTDWMDLTAFSCYQRVRNDLARAKEEHRRLMPKLKNRTATPEEKKRIKEVIQTINELQNKIEEFESHNPRLAKNILKAITKRVANPKKTTNK